MKHGKKPTRQEKKILVKAGYDPIDFLIVKRLTGELHVVNIKSNSLIKVEV